MCIDDMLTEADIEFAILIERATLAWDMSACGAMMRRMQSGYQATVESGAATRRSLGALGMPSVPGPRSRRPTAAERAREEAKAEARRWGLA